MKVVLHIDRLVVDGLALPAHAANALGETVRAELERRLGEALAAGQLDVASLSAQAGAERLVVARPVALPARLTPDGLGPPVAGAMLRGVTEGPR